MWTQRQLVEDLTAIGLPSGSAALVHVALQAVGPIEGGPETLTAALREVLGAEGTLLVPTFSLDRREPAEPGDPPAAEHLQGEYAAPTPVANQASMYGTDVLAEALLLLPDAFRSDHPALSFAAIGAEAEALTSHAPFHYPLGSEGPLARLHRRNGWILLIGVGHAHNMSLHLAEIWAEMPYVHRSAQLQSVSGEETTMLGSPGCSAGFTKIESLLRQSRIVRRGSIGDADSQLMRQQQTVSMAVTTLKGNPAALLCEDEACRPCTLARRMTAKQVSDPI